MLPSSASSTPFCFAQCRSAIRSSYASCSGPESPSCPWATSLDMQPVQAASKPKARFPFRHTGGWRTALQLFALEGFAHAQLTVRARGESEYAAAFFVTGNLLQEVGIRPT